MRGLFKLEDAKMWGGGLIILGILMIVATFILNRMGIARMYPVPPWEKELLILLLGLGITLVIIGVTVQKICNNIARMMQTYDDEMHKRIKEWIARSEQKNGANNK